MPSPNPDLLTLGLAQIAPAYLHRDATLAKVNQYVRQAAHQGCQLVTFGEALLPGYPFWPDLTDGARFNSPLQKSIFAEYSAEAVQLEAGHLDTLCATAAELQIAIYLGCIERPASRGGHSLYCSLVYINQHGEIASVHRKLMPTYEERLVWSPGDGHGLRTHPLGPFHLGGPNCWENWMPLPRGALYSQGEVLHVSVWPCGLHNTRNITRFIALESRSYVVSVSGLLHRDDIGSSSPWREHLSAKSPDVLADGGSCLAGPDGVWIIPPAGPTEQLLVAIISHHHVREERQNFDPSGHYSRPDVTRLEVDRRRQTVISLTD